MPAYSSAARTGSKPISVHDGAVNDSVAAKEIVIFESHAASQQCAPRTSYWPCAGEPSERGTLPTCVLGVGCKHALGLDLLSQRRPRKRGHSAGCTGVMGPSRAQAGAPAVPEECTSSP